MLQSQTILLAAMYSCYPKIFGGHVLLAPNFFAARDEFKRLASYRLELGCGYAALWGSHSWLQPPFRRLLKFLHLLDVSGDGRGARLTVPRDFSPATARFDAQVGQLWSGEALSLLDLHQSK